jgi:hypothetical protein
MALLLVFAPTAAGGDQVDLHLSTLTGLELLGYQEHLDPNGPDSVLARCRAGGELTTCFIDSDAAVRNVLLDLRARADFAAGWLIGGTVRVQVAKGTGREEWTLAVNEGGSPGSRQLFQTNDLTYRWYRFDLFGGARVFDLLRPILGVRISRAEQFRDAFDPEPTGITEAREPIKSTSLLLGLLGEQRGQGTVLGYRFHAAIPLAVETTNSALPTARFTNVGGYSFDAAATLAIPVNQLVRLRFEIEAGVMHWNGSDIVRIGQTGIAKWPENDTQVLIVAAGGIEFTP